MSELKKVLPCAGAAAIAAAILAGVAAAGSPASAEQIPQFSADGLAWISNGGWLDPPPGTGHGPIKQDPAHPFHGNLDGPGQVTPALGDTKDPILKPWAAAQMLASNEEVLSGRRGLPFSAQSRCWPGGIPGQLLYPIEPFYFIQMPKQVWMIWQRDHMVRRIYLTDQHSENVKPSWFGDSIGHYENGDTLVVDTVGLNTNTFVDSYQTPHTEPPHVVERHRMIEGGKAIEAVAHVEDPDAFTTPWTAYQRYRRVEQGPLGEELLIVAGDGGRNRFLL
jgi:hypothetical protein